MASSDPADKGNLAVDVGRRLRATRAALGLSQIEFGASIDLSQPRYNQYESGRRTLSVDAAIALCDRYNLTLDWLYRGDPSGLPYRLAETLRAHRD